MAATKILSLLLILCPILSFGQKSIYPKDTIYVVFKKGKGNKKITNWNYKKKKVFILVLKPRAINI